MNRLMLACLAGVLALVLARAASAQTSANPETIHRLEPASNTQRGCFPPCLCPIMLDAPVRGVFTLQLIDSNPLFDTYAVDDINWTSASGVHITGGGTYSVGGEFALMNRMQLDLALGSEPVEHFDSGWVQGGGDFPAIDITVSIHGMYCFDTAIRVVSHPVPRSDVRRYALQPPSLFQQGCFPPCLCPVWQEQPMAGSFDLVPVQILGTYREYAVVNAEFRGSGGNVPIVNLLSGDGTYIHIDGFAGPTHQMVLDLQTAGPDPLDMHFDSGLMEAHTPFPAIDIVVSVNQMVCFDTVLTISAVSKRPLPIRP